MCVVSVVEDIGGEECVDLLEGRVLCPVSDPLQVARVALQQPIQETQDTALFVREGPGACVV